jgi:hypothetical protein
MKNLRAKVILRNILARNQRKKRSFAVKEDFSEEISVLRIRDVYPRSRILIFVRPGSRISDLGSKNSNERKGGKNLFVLHFCSYKFSQKFKIILFLNWRRKKMWANLQRIVELFTPTIVIKLSKI